MAEASTRAAAGERASDGGHRAAKRALEVIEHVAASPQPVSLSEIAREVGLPKSSAHALIRTLDNEGYLQRDDRGSYSLGPRLLRLLGSLPHRFELPRVARPIMQELVDALGETAILGIRQGQEIVYVEQVEAPQVIRYVAPLGDPRPMQVTSIGKVHLALMPAEESEAILRGATFEPLTDKTLTDRGAIKEELAKVRERGFSVNNEESIEGVVAMAVPIREGGAPEGTVIAGLSVAGPAERMRDELDRMPDRLQDAARRIGEGVAG
jgi:DNA-binding IclR family transcriptional regulator